MSGLALELTRAATKDLDRLPPAHRNRLIQDLRALQSNPLDKPPRVKRLKGFSFPLYRLRAGDYRVLYRIEVDVVTVMRIINRKDLDTILRRLKFRS